MHPVKWDECLAELLLQLGELGMVAIVKMDGERPRKHWTVLVSGGPLANGNPVRWDGDDLNAGLSEIVARLQDRLPDVWK